MPLSVPRSQGEWFGTRVTYLSALSLRRCHVELDHNSFFYHVIMFTRSLLVRCKESDSGAFLL